VLYIVLIGGVVVVEGVDLFVLEDVDWFDVDVVCVFDCAGSVVMVVEIEVVYKDGDMLGGVVEVFVYGLFFGFGLYVYWDCCFDVWLVGVLMGI